MSGGVTPWQTSITLGQRLAKRQPGCTFTGEGISPRISALSRARSVRGVRLWVGADQELGVGVFWREEHAVRRPQFHQRAEIHHRHAVGDVAHHRQVVGDEQQRETQRFLQFVQQVHHLRLHGHVEGGDRLVADDELRLQHQRPGDADALALAAGKLVRIP